MSVVYSSLHTTFPVTKYDHKVAAHSTLFSKRHDKTKISFSRDNNPTNFNPLANSIITTSCTILRKRPTPCVTKQTSGSTDSTLESEKKQLKWDLVHETNLLWFLGMIVLGACAPFVYDQDAVYVAVVLFFMSGYGLTLGYHRLLSHRGFKVPKWLEYLFAYCGAHAVQRDPIFWVRAHKLHHKYSDTDKDPYTPTEGVWCSYLGWFLYNEYIGTKCGEDPNVSELKAQWFYRFLQDTYFWHPTAFAILLYLYGGFPYLAWVMGVRVTALYLFTFIPFYVIHKWGTRPWNTPDTSTNSWYIYL
ncbi:fatty acid desaturase, type 1, core [Artemisia annua]|uniref:Fatty acid desaturase, type 1, core n=1 Tax=Artemisia annua TaxID=35608 RepID=A0A2U1M0E3_ARTAN|nr:fatty acid desaturase, type 1, core [Artemisia annua]